MIELRKLVKTVKNSPTGKHIDINTVGVAAVIVYPYVINQRIDAKEPNPENFDISLTSDRYGKIESTASLAPKVDMQTKTSLTSLINACIEDAATQYQDDVDANSLNDNAKMVSIDVLRKSNQKKFGFKYTIHPKVMCDTLSIDDNGYLVYPPELEWTIEHEPEMIYIDPTKSGFEFEGTTLVQMKKNKHKSLHSDNNKVRFGHKTIGRQSAMGEAIQDALDKKAS